MITDPLATQPIDIVAMFREEARVAPVALQPTVAEATRWSRWLHYYPDLVATMAESAGVPESEVIEHLAQIAEEVRATTKMPLLHDGEVVRRYLDQFVAVQ